MLRIDHLFHDHLDGLQMHEFKLLTKKVCKLPSFFSTSLFRKIENGAGVVTSMLQCLLRRWRSTALPVGLLRWVGLVAGMVMVAVSSYPTQEKSLMLLTLEAS
ncbi:hypothetical protein HN873_001128 [Arachis hypogaea]